MDFVDAQYNKDTTANTYQHFQQLKFQDVFLKGVIFLTLKNIPKTIHPLKFKPKDTSLVHLSNEMNSKVKVENLSIGQILMLHQFPLDENRTDSPFKAIYHNFAKGEWYLEAQDHQATVIEIITNNVWKLTYSLLGATAMVPTSYSKE